MDDRQDAAGRTQSSISDSYGKNSLLLLLREAALSVRIRRSDPNRLSATLKDEKVQYPWLLSMLDDKDRAMGLTAERDELVVRPNEEKQPKENLNSKLFEQDIIVKAIAGSMKQLEKEVIPLQYKINRLKTTNKRNKWRRGEQNRSEKKVRECG